MWSPLRKHLGVATPGYLGEWHAFRQYFTGVGPRAARELFVWFEPDLLPGYAWSFPLPGGGPTSASASSGGGKVARIQDMKALWPELLARPAHRRRARARRRARGAPPGLAHPGPDRRHRPRHRPDAVRRRRRRRHRPDDRRGHRPGAPHRACSPPRPSRAGGARRRRVAAAPTSARVTRRAGRRPPHVAAARSGPCATARAPGPAVRIAGADRLDPPQLRPLAVRGLPPAVVTTPRRWRRGTFTQPGAYR